MKIEYRVVPVTRYVVTRYHESGEASGASGSVAERGEYGNAEMAYEVAYALCKAEHEALGYPLDDGRIQYPRRDRDLYAAQEAALNIAQGIQSQSF